MNNNKKNKKIILIIISIIVLISIIVGVSYAFWTNYASQKTINKVVSDCLKVELEDVTDAISLDYAYPLTDSEAAKLTPYTFKIKNVCTLSVTYDVNLEIMDDENRLASKYIAMDFNGNGKKLLTEYTDVEPTYSSSNYTAVEAKYITSGVLDANESVTYTLKIWMDESVTIDDDAMNKNFLSKISVDVAYNPVAYTEALLNGTDPVITGDLIPVTLADDGTVTKANIKEKWYSYQNKEWANAVILRDKNITYEDGDTIPEDNIESYFVWIPKYSYQLWDLGEYTSSIELSSWDDFPTTSNTHTISIKFGTTNTDDSNSGECTTPMLSGETGNCEVGDYMTPPAFITMETNGLWVGKFEIGYDGATTKSAAQVDSDDSTKIIVKPNVYSWRYNSVYNFFMASYNYERDLDSHMMKNTEWGAVAYLSFSNYGINDEIWINNNFQFITGCVGASVSASQVSSCVNKYNTTIGYNGSTTGNITGIYDMSGGAWEYMASYIDGTPKDSGFTTDSGDLTTYAKYLDVYSSASDINAYQYRILGDATGELGPFYKIGNYSYNNWYSDYANFVSGVNSWFNRGGYCGNSTGAGQFYFHRDRGNANSYYSSRLVLAI